MFCKNCGTNIDKALSDNIYSCPNCHCNLDSDIINSTREKYNLIKYVKWANYSFVLGILSIVFSLGLGLYITAPLGIHFTKKAGEIKRGIESRLCSMESPFVQKYRSAEKKLRIGIRLSKIAIGIQVALLANLFLAIAYLVVFK